MRHIAVFIIALLGCLGQANAALQIDITKGVESALPIAVVPFAWEGITPNPPENIANIVSNDLSRSGRFAPLPNHMMPQQPMTVTQIQFEQWQAAGIHNVVIGRLYGSEETGYNVEFQLFNVFTKNRVAGYNYPALQTTLRRTAHRISDKIYEAITGEPGAFDSRIAYVTVNIEQAQKVYRLKVADADGYNSATILTSNDPVFSPAWSPDGTRLAYVSQESRHTQVFVQNISTGERQRIAAWEGSNSAPAWSPDGTRLAVALSKDDNHEIYVVDLRTRALTRMTNNRSIDTEPAWSPDGKSILFTSDRGGRPQIYRMFTTGGGAHRLTFQGNYNARPSYSPDGKKVTVLNGSKGVYRIGILNLENNQFSVLSDGRNAKSPSFAPNGSMIIYAEGNHLEAVSTDGRVRQRLTLAEGGEVREPAWSPLNR
ncbi:MAG: Tol-Pal system beta propeller repeat protein TolB [Pseudomonadota bacterium]